MFSNISCCRSLRYTDDLESFSINTVDEIGTANGHGSDGNGGGDEGAEGRDGGLNLLSRSALRRFPSTFERRHTLTILTVLIVRILKC